MKKILSIFGLMSIICLTANADIYTTVCANHILVPTEKEAIQLKSQIQNLDDFKYYAKMYSTCPSSRNGGALGCFGKGQMVKPFEEAAFNLDSGEVSEPVKTQFGYHLIWVTKKY